MELRLYHGRKDPDQDMEENGFWYPVIPGVTRITVTYMYTWLVVFESEEIATRVSKATGWEVWESMVLIVSIHDDMIKALNADGDICYFGDWDIAPDDTFTNHPAGYLL